MRDHEKMDSRREYERVEGELIFFRVEAFVSPCVLSTRALIFYEKLPEATH